jgi:cytochrome oxidase Cu insertion factor (SCO1/SenC/PrrC family)
MMRVLLVAGLLVALSPLTLLAHDHATQGTVVRGSSTPPPKAEIWSDPAKQEKARNYFTDLPVIAQDGIERRFFSDVLNNKVVLIYLFFTNCDGTCPVINQKLAGVQDLLGDLLGNTINLISITTDPTHDTASVVKEYSENFGPRPGWLFLTGEPSNIEAIVRKLGHTSPDPRTHVTYLMVGNVANVKWTKLPPTASEAEIAAMLRLLVGDRKG